MSSNNLTVSELMEQLEAILNWFEGQEITVEESIKKYEQASKLSEQLEAKLNQAKNQIEVIKQQTKE